MPTVLLIDWWPSVTAIVASGIGSSLFKLAAAADAHRHTWVIDVVTSPEKAQLFAGSPGLRQVVTEPNLPTPNSSQEGNQLALPIRGICSLDLRKYDRIILLGISTPKVFLIPNLAPQCVYFTDTNQQRYKLTPHLAFWREFVAHALDYQTPLHPAEFPIVITTDELTAASRCLNKNSHWIGLSVTVISRLKEYKRWSEVINLLLKVRDDIGIVLLGTGQYPDYPDNRVINLCGHTTIRATMAIISMCAVIVGSDGLINNLGMVLGRPAVTLFSIIAPDHVVDPDQTARSSVINLVQGECPLQFCYARLDNYRYAPCPLEPMIAAEKPVLCMRFVPEMICQQIVGLLV
jgi:ADP-heptose:LPS heptosyltransferase